MDHTAISWIRRVVDQVRGSDVGFLATSMSPRWYFMDFYVYPPLIVVLVWVALAGGFWRAVLSVGLIGVGLLVWSLAEYLIHRFGFHHVPGLMEAHLEHHAEPEGLHGSPTVVTVLVFTVLAFLPLWYVVGLTSAAALTAGLATGYVAYVGVHWAVHHVSSLGPRWMGPRVRARLRALVRAHGVHHHQQTWNFGVTSTLWDRVFGTLHRR